MRVIYYLFRITCLLLVIVFFVVACARIGMPTGGSIDRVSPKAAKATPTDNSTNFSSNTFSVEFDEFIELDNVAQKLIVSPPLSSPPEVSSRLKQLVVKWNDTLKSNTTYIFDFSDAIKDFTEGNKLGNFSYSFSTGDVIDSLSYIGKVVDAYTLAPVSNKTAILYNVQRGREIIRSEKPDYITRLDTFGVFRFRNLAFGDYNLLVLDDKNQNFIYDLPTEAIAFSSMPITPIVINDSVIKTDSLPTIYYFEAEDTTNSVEAKTLLSNRRLRMVFAKSVSDSFNIRYENEKMNTLNVFSAKRDTLLCYALGETTFDTLKAEVIDGSFSEKIELYYTAKAKATAPTFAITAPGKELDYFDTLKLGLPFPCEQGLQVKAKIECDSIADTLVFVSRNDWLQSTELLKQGTNYKIYIDSGSFQNTLLQTNDSLSCSLFVSRQEDYGKISLNLNFEASNVIVILENMQKKEIARRKTGGKSKIVFENIREEKYRIKIINDANSNGKWDRGDFGRNIQPESVMYFDKVVNVRKNWEIEETITQNLKR
jgi:hypothetical protein